MSKKLTVKMTTGKILDFWQACLVIEAKDQPMSQHFSYALSLNQDAVEKYVKVFHKMDAKDRDYKEYRKALEELNIRMAKRDENGEPVQEKGRYIMESQPTFDLAVLDLREKHPAAEKREEFLETEVEVEFFQVHQRHVPPFVELGMMKFFRLFIKEEPEAFTCPSCGSKVALEDNKLKLLEVEEDKAKDVKRGKSKKKNKD